jgi:hypothetical protein
MADQANVKVQNVSTRGSIDVSREPPGGTPDYENTIATGKNDTIFLQGPEVSLIINSPGGVNTQECTITVESEQEMSLRSPLKVAIIPISRGIVVQVRIFGLKMPFLPFSAEIIHWKWNFCHFQLFSTGNLLVFLQSTIPAPCPDGVIIYLSPFSERMIW